MPAAPQPLTATHARRAAALAAISAVLVLVACAVLSWRTLGRFTSGHPMSGDDVVTVAFAVIAALALARLGAICLLSSRDLWGQAGMDERRPTPAEGGRHLSASTASAGEHRAAGSPSRSRARAASVFLAIAAFSGIGASSAGAATLPTSTSSTQSLPGTGAPSAALTTPQDASALPTTNAPAAEAPSPDFAAPSDAASSDAVPTDAVSDAPSPVAPSSGTPSSDAPSPDASWTHTPTSDAQPSPSTRAAQSQVSSPERTETSPAAQVPASSSPTSSPQVDSSPVTAPSFTAAAALAASGASTEPASQLADTSCADSPASDGAAAFSSNPTDDGSSADEKSAAPEPGWTPPPAPDRALCRLVTSGSVSFNRTDTAAPATHVVLRGDTLWSIAASRLPADAPAEDIAAAVSAWIEANPSLAPHPDLLSPGDILQAPTPGTTSALPQASSETDSGVQR